MKTVALGSVVVLIGFVIAAVAAPDRQDGIPPRGAAIHFYPNAANSDMIAVSANVRDQYQQVTVIEPKQRRIAVYHVDYVTGAITLRAVRSFEFDLQMTQFNAKDPLPEELRALQENRASLPPR
jgi:hypothetical protein